MNTIAQQYAKERRRLTRFVKAVQKRGFIVPENFIPPKVKKPTRASVNRLKKLNPKTAYEKFQYVSPETGDILSGVVGRRLERIRAQKPKLVDNVLKHVEDEIANWAPSPNWSEGLARLKEQDKNILQSLLKGAINQFGRKTVAKRLEEHALEVYAILDEALKESGGKYKNGRDDRQASLQKFSSIVMGRAISRRESIELTEAAEYNEDYSDSDDL